MKPKNSKLEECSIQQDWDERLVKSKPRASVMKNFQASVEKNRRLGELLAQWPEIDDPELKTKDW